MDCKLVCILALTLGLQVIVGARLICPSNPDCVCGGTLSVELNCNIDGRMVKINLLPDTYINIKCENATSLDYNKIPKCANRNNSFKSVSFKDCPLPSSSFKEVLKNIGVSKTMALIFQNTKNLGGDFERKHFAGLQDLTKLLLSVNGITHLPDNLFTDINNLTWLNIRSNSINLSDELFKPLERLETLEISHNHMTNISSNLFSHLSFLRKLSLWQSNVTWFSQDFFSGVDELEELDLSSNGLNEIPASIFKPLKKLKKLTLFSNKFSSLPQNLFKSNDELETVIILNNDVKLKALSKSLFGKLPNLKQVYIQRCGIEDVPYDVFVSSSLITNISLAYNDIKTLPESTFNDQINLLELDLSYNNLNNLKPKLFSSLVRLEKLNLCHNSLVELSGSTFSSLLSLINLNMEHNNLKTISSYLFSNNKQRMSINLAYNELTFDDRKMMNNTELSPFAHTYNLKLLNLSHNHISVPCNDWWINGHDIVDVSYNNLRYLWGNEEQNAKKSQPTFLQHMKKPLKEIWITKNPFGCKCNFVYFIDSMKDLKTKIGDEKFIKCNENMSGEICYKKTIITVVIIVTILIILYIIIIVYYVHKGFVHMWLKQKIYVLTHGESNPIEIFIDIKYSEKDEDFLLKELIPGLNEKKNLKIMKKPIDGTFNNDNAVKHSSLKTKNTLDQITDMTLVIFSPNYLASTYSHMNIKKIRGEMLKSKFTVYIFVDMEAENSLYAFLKEQRDPKTSILWGDNDYWEILLSKIYENVAPTACYEYVNSEMQKLSECFTDNQV